MVSGKTLEHKWSVDDLTSQVKSQLYERQAVANKISNFERRLPAEQKDMVVSTMKDPYMFDFINYTEEMLETDIENELVKMLLTDGIRHWFCFYGTAVSS